MMLLISYANIYLKDNTLYRIVLKFNIILTFLNYSKSRKSLIN